MFTTPFMTDITIFSKFYLSSTNSWNLVKLKHLLFGKELINIICTFYDLTVPITVWSWSELATKSYLNV